MKIEKVLGYDVVASDKEAFLHQVLENLRAGDQKTVFAINPEKVVTAEENLLVKEMLHEADYLIPDGNGIVYASKKLGGEIRQTITGVDLAQDLCRLAGENHYSVFLYGAKEEVVKGAEEKLKEKYGPVIAGRMNGYEKDDEKIIRAINQSGAQILLVALGSPKQEVWMSRYRGRLEGVKILQGVGGSFDVFAGAVARAPKIFRKLRLEWLYRMIRQPSRLKRNVKLLDFMAMVRQAARKNKKS